MMATRALLLGISKNQIAAATFYVRVTLNYDIPNKKRLK